MANHTVGVPLHSGIKDSRALTCLTFRTIPDQMGARRLDITDNDDYLDTGAWYRNNWDLSDLVAAGMEPQYREFLEQARNLWYKILTELSWVPNSVAVATDRAISAGFLPQMVATSIWQSQYGPLPGWLESPYRQAAWNELRDDLGDLNQQVSAANLQKLNARAASLRGSREFWDKVATYSGVDKLGQMWTNFKAKVQTFNTKTEVARDAVVRMKALVGKNPEYFTQEQQAKVTEIAAQAESNVEQLKGRLGSAVLRALADDGQDLGALGVAPIVLIGLGVAAMAAATAIITTWVVQAEKTARLAIDHEHELLMTAEKAAAAAHKARQDAILAREQELHELRAQNKISPSEFQAQMAQLEERARANEVDLARRREQNTDIAQAHAKSMDALRKSEVTGGLAQMGNIAMWGALGVGALILGPPIVRAMSKK
jgi:hypothetical protein